MGLYHPCADPEQVSDMIFWLLISIYSSTKVSELKSTIRGCLFRHVLTPYPELTSERPIALVGWSASLEMSHFNISLAKYFMKVFAKTGPERTFRDGQYRHLLTERALYVTNVIDETICPLDDVEN